ncbi:hypothetical protein FJ364_03365 [Candidatus Dependentiae bacterium]|nr:hypothetical protein [Candidatus Dependentiae bacterium]
MRTEQLQEQVNLLRTLGDTAIELVDNIIALDTNLSSEQKVALMKIGERVQDNLNLIARQAKGRVFTAQAAAKVTVFVIQGLLEISGILAIQVQKLSLADKPELVQRRNRYTHFGITAVCLAGVLSAVITATNAAGYTDIQIVPSISNVFKSLIDLL